jgi:hypothetical protein
MSFLERFNDWRHMTFWPVWGHNRQDKYPWDMDGAEKFTRPKTGYDYWGTHSNSDNYQQLGYVSGFMVEMDTRIWSSAFGHMPFGPSQGSMPQALGSPLPINLQWQITVPGLTKGTTNLGAW